MQNSEFKTIEEFIREYGSSPSKDYETYIGLEFEYNKTHYRLCKEPCANNEFYLYIVSLKNPSKEYVLENLDFKIIGTFKTMDELLNSKLINGKLFQDIILDSDTVFLSKD